MVATENLSSGQENVQPPLDPKILDEEMDKEEAFINKQELILLELIKNNTSACLFASSLSTPDEEQDEWLDDVDSPPFE